jgi:predicted Kef-type K+ transport protein
MDNFVVAIAKVRPAELQQTIIAGSREIFKLASLKYA